MRAIKRLSMLTMLQGILIGVFLSLWVVLSSMFEDHYHDFLLFGVPLGFSLLVPFSFILEGFIVLLSWKRENLRAQLPGIWRPAERRSTPRWFGRFFGLWMISNGIFLLVAPSLLTIGDGFYAPLLIPVAAAFAVNWLLTLKPRSHGIPQMQASEPASAPGDADAL